MLCTVALRRRPAQIAGASYTLRITGNTALGPSGTGGRETRDGLSEDEVLAMLQALGMDETTLALARKVMHDAEHGDRFASIAEDVQIPFARLERADVFLFD